eukprot:8044435-Alexandrium_andersonii.AAC.1
MCIRDRQTYQERLLFIKRCLGLEKHRALAQAASGDAPASMEVGALEPEAEDLDTDSQELQAAFAVFQ